MQTGPENHGPEDTAGGAARRLSKDGSASVTDERVNTITSVIGACVSLLGSALLISQAAAQGDAWKIVGFSVYGLSLLTLFVSSALHHGISAAEAVERRLRTFDYVSVFGLIGGTVTPIVLVLDRSVVGWAVLGSVWAVALLGIVLRSVRHDLPRHITNTLYIVLGWFPAVLVLGLTNLPLTALTLIVLGGLIYSAGFVIYTTERPNFRRHPVFGFHELWHCCVIAGALAHYLFMYWYVLPK